MRRGDGQPHLREFDMQMIAKPPFSEIEADVLSRITEERWLALASELIRTGQPRFD